MSKESISGKESIALIVYFILNSALIFPTAVEAGRDLWIAIAVAMVPAFIMALVYGRILAVFPGKDLFDILDTIFGKIVGRAFSILYIWFAIQLASLVLRDFGEFFGDIIIGDTPMAVILTFFSIVVIFVLKEGIEVMGRFSLQSIMIVIAIILGYILVLISKYNIDNIRPIMENGFFPIMKGAFSSFAFPFGEIVIFTMILSSLGNNESIYKVYVWGLLAGGAIIFITELNHILVIGIDMYESLYFPPYTVVRRAGIGDVFQRFEMIGNFIVVPAGLVKASVCMLGASKGVAKVFDLKDYRPLVVPLTLLMTNLAYFSFNSIMDLSVFSGKYWPYYAVIFQVILPIIILIGAEIRRGKTKSIGGISSE